MSEATQQKHELDSPVWAVISSEGVEADRLTYERAQQITWDLTPQRGSSLAIVTQDTADRLNKQ